jgi:YhcH/YjgK/YiaL family protein
MIADRLDNIGIYGQLNQRVARGLALLKEQHVQTAAVGRHAVQGDELYFLVQEYQTRPMEPMHFEIHRRHLDIQYIASGLECIGYHPLEGMTEVGPYDATKDAALYQTKNPFTRIALSAGMLAIFWPLEPHLPCRTLEVPDMVRKIVIKVRMD